MADLLSPYRVFVVEDEMMVLMNIEYMLGDLGCTAILTAATVTDALEIVAAEHFDFAILDVNLDGEPNYLIADALASREIPFVFSTGYSDNRIAERFNDRPGLKKPYSDKDLISAIARMMPAAPSLAV